MAVKTKKIKYKTCRYYCDGGVWVSLDGTTLGYFTKPTELFQFTDKVTVLRKKKDVKGHYYVENRFGRRVYIAHAVSTCWGPIKPKDGKHYQLTHKDGDKKNNHRNNLDWVAYHYEHCSDKKTKIEVQGEIITVRQNGTFLQEGNPISVISYGYDSDIDSHYACSPVAIIHYIKGYINGYRVDPDELMKKAGYINGDDAGMTDPVILHLDHDPENFDSCNLEFCESKDPRYQEYEKKIDEYIDKTNENLVAEGFRSDKL